MNIAVAERRAWELVKAERLRQIAFEGYTPAHDDEHTEGQLALLAAAYAMKSRQYLRRLPRRSLEGETAHRLTQLLDIIDWPFKPADPIRDLTRAGALILAELERRLRAVEDEGSGSCSVCQTETTYTGEHNGDYGVWLCPDHGGKP